MKATHGRMILDLAGAACKDKCKTASISVVKGQISQSLIRPYRNSTNANESTQLHALMRATMVQSNKVQQTGPGKSLVRLIQHPYLITQAPHHVCMHTSDSTCADGLRTWRILRVLPEKLIGQGRRCKDIKCSKCSVVSCDVASLHRRSLSQSTELHQRCSFFTRRQEDRKMIS